MAKKIYHGLAIGAIFALTGCAALSVALEETEVAAEEVINVDEELKKIVNYVSP